MCIALNIYLLRFKSAGIQITFPGKYDFLIEDKYLFEVGGKNKSVKDNDVFIAADGIETGWGNKIPLWLLGFLY